MKKIYKITLFLTMVFAAANLFAQEANERDRGIGLYRQGEYEKAIEVFQNRVKVEEKDRLAWLYMGGALVKLKKNDEAVKAFRKTNVVYSENLPVYDKKLNVISKTAAGYTEKARKNRVTGNVTLAVEFGADGKIGFVFPFEELPDGLTEKAVEAAKRVKFEPAVQGGKPVTVISVISYGFLQY